MRPNTSYKCLYTELVLVLGLSQTHRNMHNNISKSSNLTYRKMPQWEPHLEIVKHKGAMELVALYDSFYIGQGPNLVPVLFYCYRYVNSNTLFCYNFSSTGSSPQFSISSTTKWWPMRSSQLVCLSIQKSDRIKSKLHFAFLKI